MHFLGHLAKAEQSKSTPWMPVAGSKIPCPVTQNRDPIGTQTPRATQKTMCDILMSFCQCQSVSALSFSFLHLFFALLKNSQKALKHGIIINKYWVSLQIILLGSIAVFIISNFGLNFKKPSFVQWMSLSVKTETTVLLLIGSGNGTEN